MTASTQAISPLRQRMLDDMRLRKLRPKTQTGYVRAVRYLAAFLQRSPDTATAEDLRRFQLHMVDRGVSNWSLHLESFRGCREHASTSQLRWTPWKSPNPLPAVATART